MNKLLSAKSGFSLVELIVAIAIFVTLVAGVSFLALGTFDVFTGKNNYRHIERLAQEAVEVLKIIKEKSWTDIASNASQDPSAIQIVKNELGTWEFEVASSTHGVFTRGIYLYTVQRNSSHEIVSSGGTVDPATVRAEIRIAASGMTDYVLEVYVADWEAYRMEQTDWSGDSGEASWVEGQADYYSKSTMDTTSNPGDMKVATST